MMVVISHLLGSYFFQKPYVSAVIGSDIEPRLYSDFAIVLWLSEHHLNINFGPLGVSIFFLISGFVIMFSLGKMSPSKFLCQRWFRILPTYWISLIVCFGFTLVSSYYFGNSSGYLGYDINGFISNILLYNDIAGYSSMDFVNWSLTIEIAFYITFAVLACAKSKTKDEKMLNLMMIAMTTLMVFYFVIKFMSFSLPAWVLTSIYRSKFIDYMCIGYAFFLHFQGKISLRKLIALSSVFFVLFWVEMLIEEDINQMKVIGTNYAYGLTIFSICYALKNRFEKVKVLDFLADVSYPLYLLHATCGYALISVLLDLNFGMNASFIISLIVLLFFAWSMHRLIEVPFNNIGKKLTIKAAPTL